MPLKRAIINILIFFPSFLLSFKGSAQTSYDSRYNAVLAYNHRTLEAPPGMVYVPGGSTTIKYDQSSTDSNSLKKVSLTSFFMDKTETTNQQYRDFVNWVIDSIAVVKYLKDDDLFLKDDNDTTAATSTATALDTTARPIDTSVHTTVTTLPSATDTSKHTAAVVDTNVASKKRINWAKVDHDKIFDPGNSDYHSKLLPLLDENGNIKKDAYVFSYNYIKVFGTSNIKNSRKSEIKKLPVNVYPDEQVWTQDLTNSQTDMYVENYFNAPPFDNYPVVGVSWTQASAFAYWRSITAGSYAFMPEYMDMYHLTYTLPSEAQWVYAAQGFYDMIVASDTAVVDTIPKLPSDTVVSNEGHDSTYMATYYQAKADKAAQDSTTLATAADARQARIDKRKADKKFNYYIIDYLNFSKYGGKYATGQPQGGVASGDTAFGDDVPVIDSSPIHFDKYGMLSNFKQDEGDYWEDGAALSTPAMSFAPNEFGLYNMEGNVSEWVMDAYSPSAYSFVSDLNPVLLYDADSSDADAMKRKVIRGGSFMSNARALNPYYRDVELQNVAHCYLGFRCVMQAPEILHKNVSTRNRTVKGNRIKNRIFPELHLQEIH